MSEHSDRKSEAVNARCLPCASAVDCAPELSINCVQDVSELADFKADWLRLEAQSADQFAYFQSFDWCMTWCQHYLVNAEDAKPPELRVFVVKRDGQVVMIWPMLQTETAFGLSLLTFIGDELGQYSSMVSDRSSISDRDVIACWNRILAFAKPDVVALNKIPASARLARVCGEAGIAVDDQTTAMMDLASFSCREDLDASFNATTRRNRRKRRNRLADGHKLVLENIDGGSAEFGRLVQLAFCWKREWLSRTGRFNANISDDRALLFISSLSEGAVALALKRDGQPVAVEIGFLRGDHYYSYIGAFDWSLHKLSPGKVQMDEALGWLIDNDVRYFDLLGNPSGYKQDWSNVEVGLRTVLHPMTLKGYAYALIWLRFAKPLAKAAFYRLPASIRVRFLENVGKASQTRDAVREPPRSSAGGRHEITRYLMKWSVVRQSQFAPIDAWSKWQGSIINILLAGLVAGAGFEPATFRL